MQYNKRFTYKCQVFYNENMQARNMIKSLAALRCVTLTKLAEMMAQATGKPYTFKSLVGKMQRGTVSLDEAYLIADLLGYKLEFVDKNINNN